MLINILRSLLCSGTFLVLLPRIEIGTNESVHSVSNMETDRLSSNYREHSLARLLSCCIAAVLPRREPLTAVREKLVS
jgi:hypothetical protein